jgi:hypothetical protein
MSISISKSLQLTRYLYSRVEVECALVCALLEKQEEKALFWGLELVYSGFNVFDLLFTIYYDFYYTLHPSFETYLGTVYKEWLSSDKGVYHVANVIINLCFRASSTDIFFLRNVIKQFEIDIGVPKTEVGFASVKDSFHVWLAEQNFESIAQYILVECAVAELPAILTETYDYFTWTGVTIRKNIGTSFMKLFKSGVTEERLRHMLLSRIVHMFVSIQPPVKPQNIYLKFDEALLTSFHTIMDLPREEKERRGLIRRVPLVGKNETVDWHLPYKILPMAYQHSVSSHSFMSMFRLGRNRSAQLDAGWLYYASNTPYWRKVLDLCGAVVDHSLGRVTFPICQKEEDFFQTYGLEPDEQGAAIQDCAWGDFVACNALQFYETFRTHNIVPIYPDYLQELEPVEYSYSVL